MTRSTGAGGLRVACMAALAALIGCSGTSVEEDEFRPVESGRGVETTATGAYYELRGDRGTVGDAKVTWRGLAEGPEDVHSVRIALRLRNDSEVPLAVARERIELEMKTGAAPPWVIDEFDLRGEPTVQPGDTERVELVFQLPAGAELDELEWFELNWGVVTADANLSYSTPFVRQRGRGRGFAPGWGWGRGAYYASPYWGYPGYYSPYYPYFYYDYPLY